MKKGFFRKVLALCMVVFIMFGTICLPQGNVSAAGFSDIPAGAWYLSAVNKLLDDGVITIPYNGEFNPDESIKGSEVAQLMFNAMKKALMDKETNSTVKASINAWKAFGDVPTDFWAYPYMRSYYNFFAKEKKDEVITREVFCVAMVGAKRLDYNANGRVFALDPTLYSSAAINGFQDKNSTSFIYQYFVELCLENNVMSGTTVSGKKYLYPVNAVTKAEAAQFIYNALYTCTNNNFVYSSNGIVAPKITAIQKDINVGIIILDKAYNSDNVVNPDSDLFRNLDKNINKPMDWNLVNPMVATNTATGLPYGKDDVARDSNNNIMYDSSGNKTYKYWEVNLNDQVAQDLVNKYSILFLTSHSLIKLTQQNSAIIKDYIAKGGQMFIEDCDGLSIHELDAAGNDTGTNFLGIGFTKNNYSDTKNKTRYDQVIYDSSNIHPLLNNIFTISPTIAPRAGSKAISNNEITRLGDLDEYSKKTAYITGLTLQNGVAKYATNTVVSKGVSYEASTQVIVKNQIGSNFYPSLVASNIGKGRLILSANDVACGICDVVNGGGNGVEDYKFFYNVIGWTGRVSIDFREMESKVWENVNPQKVELTATISNFGGREQEYILVPTASEGWSLTTPTFANTSSVVTSTYGSSDGKLNGYPKTIKLAQNQSIKVVYTLRSDSMEIGESYQFNVQAKAVDNEFDKDTAPYTMTVKSITLNTPSLLTTGAISVDSKVNYCASTDLVLNIPAAVIDAIDQPTNGLTYKLYLTGFKQENSGALTTLQAISVLPGSTYSDKLSNKDKYFTAKVNSNTAQLVDASGTATTINNVTSTIDTSGSSPVAVVTIPKVKFSSSNQNIKATVSIDGLYGDTNYKFEGHVICQAADGTSVDLGGGSSTTTTTGSVPAGTQIRLEYSNGGVTGDTARIYPRFILYNTGTTGIDLSKIKVRYFYTGDGIPSGGQKYAYDDAKINSGDILYQNYSSTGISMQYTKVTNSSINCDYYQDTVFNVPYILDAGKNFRVQPQLYKEIGTGEDSMRNYKQSNDYSFDATATSTYKENKNMCVYYDGILIWGTEPEGITTATGGTSYSINGAAPTKASDKFGTTFNLGDVGYNNPRITVSSTAKTTGTKYNATLKVVIPKYTDEASLPVLYVKDKDGKDVFTKTLSAAGAGLSDVERTVVVTSDLNINEHYTATITVTSTAANGNKSVSKDCSLIIDLN